MKPHTHEQDAAEQERRQKRVAAAQGYLGHYDHQDHHAHMAADFRKRFWMSLALSLPILLLSPMLQALVGLRDAVRFAGDI